MKICHRRWLRALPRKEAQLMYARIYCYNVWGRLSNLKHVSLYCCIIMHSSSAAAVPINVSLQFTCCHFMHCVITTFQSRSHLPVMPRPSEAVWGVGSSCILRLLKTLVWQAAFPRRACQLPSPIMFSSCWWNAKAYRKQVVKTGSNDPLSSISW